MKTANADLSRTGKELTTRHNGSLSNRQRFMGMGRTAMGVAALLLGAMAPAAHAADLNGRVQTTLEEGPAYRAVPLWQGFYAGLGLGYGWGDSQQEYNRNDNHGVATTSPEGWAGNVTAGYNWRPTQSLVLGIEGDLGVMDLRADDKEVYDGHIYKTQFGPTWGTVRGRLGFAWNRLLIYGTAGMAFMDVDEVSLGNTPGETAYNRSFRAGWTAGGGIEYALTDTISTKVEYLHMDFGRHNGLSDNRETFYFDNKVDLIRTGLNVRF